MAPLLAEYFSKGQQDRQRLKRSVLENKALKTSNKINKFNLKTAKEDRPWVLEQRAKKDKAYDEDREYLQGRRKMESVIESLEVGKGFIANAPNTVEGFNAALDKVSEIIPDAKDFLNEHKLTPMHGATPEQIKEIKDNLIRFGQSEEISTKLLMNQMDIEHTEKKLGMQLKSAKEIEEIRNKDTISFDEYQNATPETRALMDEYKDMVKGGRQSGSYLEYLDRKIETLRREYKTDPNNETGTRLNEAIEAYSAHLKLSDYLIERAEITEGTKSKYRKEEQEIKTESEKEIIDYRAEVDRVTQKLVSDLSLRNKTTLSITQERELYDAVLANEYADMGVLREYGQAPTKEEKELAEQVAKTKVEAAKERMKNEVNELVKQYGPGEGVGQPRKETKLDKAKLFFTTKIEQNKNFLTTSPAKDAFSKLSKEDKAELIKHLIRMGVDRKEISKLNQG